MAARSAPRGGRPAGTAARAEVSDTRILVRGAHGDAELPTDTSD
jgi:hypothetical protein